MTTVKEEIYDREIAPLMENIIGICKENKIAVLMQFALGKDDTDEELLCTTSLLEDSHEPTEEQLHALKILFGRRASFAAFTISKSPDA